MSKKLWFAPRWVWLVAFAALAVILYRRHQASVQAAAQAQSDIAAAAAATDTQNSDDLTYPFSSGQDSLGSGISYSLPSATNGGISTISTTSTNTPTLAPNPSGVHNGYGPGGPVTVAGRA